MSETRSTVFVHTLTPIASYIPRSISARNSPRIWLSHFSGEPQVSEQRSFKCASGYRHGWRASVPPGRRARGRQRHRAGLHAGHPRRRRLLRRARPGPQPAGGRHPREGSGRGGGGGVDAAPVGPDADGHGAGADRGDAAAGALQPRAGARGHRGDDADGRVRVVGGVRRGGGGGAGVDVQVPLARDVLAAGGRHGGPRGREAGLQGARGEELGAASPRPGPNAVDASSFALLCVTSVCVCVWIDASICTDVPASGAT
ncbi:hypothetical protein VPH35_097407 [Triticum aestivum]